MKVIYNTYYHGNQRCYMVISSIIHKKKTEKRDTVPQLNQYVDGTHSVQFYGSYLKLDSDFYHDDSISFYVVYRPGSIPNSKFTLNVFLAVFLQKKKFCNRDKYTYSGHRFCFNSKTYERENYADILLCDLIIFGVDLSNSNHAEN